jgi:LuxR family maltose regulon positive regulatory protein
MFRDALLIQGMARYDNSTIAGLHAKAANWFAENNMLIETIYHYNRGDKTEKAITIFTRHRLKLQDGQHWSLLEKLLNEFPEEVIQTTTHLAFSQAWLLIYQGKAIEMFDRLPDLESLLNRAELEKTDLNNLTGELNVLKSYKSYNVDADFKAAHDQAHIAIENLLKHNIYPLGIAWVFFAGCHQAIGISHVAINRIVAMLNDKTYERLQPYLFMALHYVYWLDGDLTNLEKSSEKSLNLSEKENDFEGQANAGYFNSLSLYLQNRIDQSIEIAKRSYDLRYQTIGIHQIGIAYVLVLNYLADSKVERAARVIDEMSEYATSKGNPYFMIIKEAMEAELDWNSGNDAKANKWANRRDEIPLYPLSNAFSLHLSRIKLLIYQEDTEAQKQAAQLLEKLETYISPMHNQRFLIDVIAWQAVLNFDKGNQGIALEKLKQSLELAEPGGFIRNYLDMGPKLANVLKFLSQKETKVRYIAKILNAFKEKELSFKTDDLKKEEKKPEQKEGKRSGIDLTDRESEILSLISQHLQNKEIGEKLFISTETVKKHTNRIYHKLHVDNRRKAVEKAQTLGII